MSLKNKLQKRLSTLSRLPVIGELFEPRPKVAVLRLSGVIAESTRKQTLSHHKLSPLIEEAFETHNAKAVALVINSPGGSPAQSALIARHIRKLSDDKDLPVMAFVEDVAASGGYWLACAADEIYAQDVSIIGSIGVISASFGFQELIARYGVERRVHTSGGQKSFLDPFLPEKPADIKRLKDIQKDLHQIFIDWVETRRADKLNGTKKDLFEGQFWTAGDAKDKGLIDAVGDLRSVAREKFGEDVKFVELAPSRGLLAGLLGGDIRNAFPGADDLIESAEHRAIWARFGL